MCSTVLDPAIECVGCCEAALGKEMEVDLLTPGGHCGSVNVNLYRTAPHMQPPVMWPGLGASVEINLGMVFGYNGLRAVS